MHMKRSAILITGDKTLHKGVEVMDEFLRSYIGGAWRNEEIIKMSCGDRAGVVSAVETAQLSEFALVYFIGQGETRKFDLPWTETCVQLSSGETLMESLLNPGAPRCSLILDCVGTPLQTSREMTHLASDVHQEESDIEWARRTYDEAICAAEAGLVKVLATAIDQNDGIKKLFTQHLVNAVNDWAVEGRGVLSYGDAVVRAARTFTAEVPDGVAAYRGGRRLKDFPFGVNH